MTALAAPAQPTKAQAEPATAGESVSGVVPQGNAVQGQPEPEPPKRSPAHYLWAVLIARIYEVSPLLCPAAQPASDNEVDQRVNGPNGNSDALRGRPACGMRGAADIALPQGAFWGWACLLREGQGF